MCGLCRGLEGVPPPLPYAHYVKQRAWGLFVRVFCLPRVCLFCPPLRRRPPLGGCRSWGSCVRRPSVGWAPGGGGRRPRCCGRGGRRWGSSPRACPHTAPPPPCAASLLTGAAPRPPAQVGEAVCLVLCLGAAGWVVPRCVSSSRLWGRRARGVGLGGAMGLGGGAPVPGGGGGGCSWSFYGAGGRGCSPLGGLVVLWGLVVNPPPPPPGGVSFFVFPVVAAWGWPGGGGGVAALPADSMLSRPSSRSTGVGRGRSDRRPCSILSCCMWLSPSLPQTCSRGIAWRSR